MSEPHEKAPTDMAGEEVDSDCDWVHCTDTPKDTAAPTTTATPAALSDDDVLTLDVGGEIFRCRRGTLRLVRGSRLEQLFSMPGFAELTSALKNPGDAIFLDWNPVSFRIIINYLRSYSLNPAAPPLITELSGRDQVDFKILVQHLQLEDVFFPAALDEFDAEKTHASITLADGGRRATASLTAPGKWLYTCGRATVKQGDTARWSLRVHAAPRASLAVGVTDVDCCSCHLSVSLKLAGHYMWYPGNGKRCQNGENSDWATADWQAGELVELVLDTAKHELSLSVPRLGALHKMPVLPGAQGWRLCIFLASTGQSVEVQGTVRGC